jgi:hypothetical protein
MLQHVSIFQSYSGSIYCALLKLYSKTFTKLLCYSKVVLWQHVCKEPRRGSQRSGGIVIQWCKCGRTRLVRVISIIHDATTVHKGRKDRKTNMEIKKPYAVSQYNNFIKCIDMSDYYISFHSVLTKTLNGRKKR